MRGMYRKESRAGVRRRLEAASYSTGLRLITLRPPAMVCAETLEDVKTPPGDKASYLNSMNLRS